MAHPILNERMTLALNTEQAACDQNQGNGHLIGLRNVVKYYKTPARVAPGES